MTLRNGRLQIISFPTDDKIAFTNKVATIPNKEVTRELCKHDGDAKNTQHGCYLVSSCQKEFYLRAVILLYARRQNLSVCFGRENFA